MSESILQQLKAQESNLKETLDRTTTELARVQGAIASLEGKPPGTVVARKATGPTSVEMIEAGARALENKNTAATPLTFDRAELRLVCLEMFPGYESRLLGTSYAIERLIAKKVFVRVPGGYQLAP